MTRIGHQGAVAAVQGMTHADPAGRSGAVRMMRAVAVLGAALTLALSGPAAALEPLAKERYINDRLIAARIADRIRRECPTIDGRLILAYQQARALQRYARDKGYSDAEIKAFLDSKPDKKRIYAIAEDYMTRKGATKGDPQSYCRLGRAEIAARTVTGSLLVSK